LGELFVLIDCKFHDDFCCLQPDEPLEQATRFLTPLQHLNASNIETHLMAFEIAIRKGFFSNSNFKKNVNFLFYSDVKQKRCC
jgi:NMDA receptor-regulated protein 1